MSLLDNVNFPQMSVHSPHHRTGCQVFMGFPGVALVVKNPSAKARDARDVGSILGQEDPLEEEMATRSSILENPHGQRHLAGYSP